MASQYNPGGSILGGSSQFAEAPDGTLVNFAMAQSIAQEDKSVVLTMPGGLKTQIQYASATLAAAALKGISDFLTAQFSTLTMKSITPSTGANGATINAVLLGSGFQYDALTGSFTGAIAIGGNAATVTFVNSNVLLLQFTAPAVGAADIVYTPTIGAAVTLTAGWTST
jgi:hypothetical protein